MYWSNEAKSASYLRIKAAILCNKSIRSTLILNRKYSHLVTPISILFVVQFMPLIRMQTMYIVQLKSLTWQPFVDYIKLKSCLGPESHLSRCNAVLQNRKIYKYYSC